MNIQRETTISTLDEMCELMCGGVEFEEEVNRIVKLGLPLGQAECYVANYLDQYICLEHNGGCKGIDKCRNAKELLDKSKTCKGCRCDNTMEEHISCCYCQDGDLYEKEVDK